MAGGVTLGSVGIVGMSGLAVHRRWIGSTSSWLRLAIGAIGALLSGIGLAVLDDSRDVSRSFVSAGVGALACAAILALVRRWSGARVSPAGLNRNAASDAGPQVRSVAPDLGERQAAAS